MDYLRTLGSAAVSSIVQKSGLNLPFSLGERITSFDGQSIWTLNNATKRDDGSVVSVFSYENSGSKHVHGLTLAKNALRKLRTTRHPDVLKYIDSVETETAVFIVTERVKPLKTVRSGTVGKSSTEMEDWIVWGLHRVSTALAFINDPCSSIHGNLIPESLFVSESGEWKLGGFELLSNSSDGTSIIFNYGSSNSGSSVIPPPEVQRDGWTALKNSPVFSTDGYSLGVLIHALFNPDFPPPATTSPPHPPPTPTSRGKIPPVLFTQFKKLLHPIAKSRASPQSFLEAGMASTGDGSGYFLNNRLCKICAGLDNFALSSESEKIAFLNSLKDGAKSFPPEFASAKILPSLVSALEFGGASASTIVPLILQLGDGLAPSEYDKCVLAPIIKLFASSDRATRMVLLDTLPSYAERLESRVIVDKIWPNLQTGFSDTVPVLREATVKSIDHIASKLSDRILNNDLLRHLAKLQLDQESSIRTNSCILLGRLAPSLGYNTKRKVLVPAFARSLKDPFVHARVAGLMAFMATIDVYEVDELATKVIPSMSFALVDKEKPVRDQAFKAIELFMKRIELHVAKMPETALTEATNSTPSLNTGTVNSAVVVNSAAGAASALAGWAMNSLGRKLATSEANSAIQPTITLDRSSSVPPIKSNGDRTSIPSPSLSASGSNLQENKPSGMKLGAARLGASRPDSSLFIPPELDDELEEPPNDAWSGDLIDVNADDDDWSAFTSAPAILRPLNHSKLRVEKPIEEDAWEAQLPNIAAPLPRQTPPKSDAGTTAPPPKPTQTTVAPRISQEPAKVLNKEEKAAEITRRKEERRQRIAMLKEQKKPHSGV